MGLRPELNRNLSSTSTGVSTNLSASTSLSNGSISVSPLPTSRLKNLTAPRKDKEDKGKQMYPNSLPLMLDGSHHTDEICIKYGIGLGHLEMVLRSIGGVVGEEEGSNKGGSGKEKDFGDVVLLYV